MKWGLFTAFLLEGRAACPGAAAARCLCRICGGGTRWVRNRSQCQAAGPGSQPERFPEGLLPLPRLAPGRSTLEHLPCACSQSRLSAFCSQRPSTSVILRGLNQSLYLQAGKTLREVSGSSINPEAPTANGSSAPA